jgi:hypothetical protein
MTRYETRRRSAKWVGLLLLASSAGHAQTVASELRAVPGPSLNRFEGTVNFGSVSTVNRPLLGGELLPVVNAPFSGVGTTTHVQKLLDGNRVTRKDTSTYHRDGQGRMRIERSMGTLGVKMPGFMFVSITDPVTGRMLSLQPQAKTYYEYQSSVPVPPLQPPVKGSPPQIQTVFFGTFFGVGASPENFREIPLGEKTIDGLRVVGTRVEQTIPAGSIGNDRAIISVAESWFSEALGVVVESTQRSPTGIESYYRLSQIVRGEPARELFSAPADYARQETNNSFGPMFQGR